MNLPPLEYRTTRGRMALYALGSLAFVVLGFWMAGDGEGGALTHFWGWPTMAFFGLGLFISIREIVSPHVSLRLDEEGIHSRQAFAGSGFDLPWSELAGIQVVTMNRQPMVVLHAATADWGMSEARPAVRRMRAANVALVGSWMVVAPRVIGAKPQEVVANLESYHRHYTPGAPVEYPRPA